MWHIYDMMENLVMNKVLVFLNMFHLLMKGEIPSDEDHNLIIIIYQHRC